MMPHCFLLRMACMEGLICRFDKALCMSYKIFVLWVILMISIEVYAFK